MRQSCQVATRAVSTILGQVYSCHQISAYSDGTASAEILPASVESRVYALAAVTVTVENACAARFWLKQVSEARKVVSANSQVRGCSAASNTLRRSDLLAKPASCHAQYSGVSAKQQAVAIYTGGSKGLTAWTSLPLIEVQPDQSTKLCLQCHHLHRQAC